jgi:DoxX-like family
MNTLLWMAQILLAGVFFFTGVSKVLAYDKVVKAVEARTKGHKVGMSRGLAAQLGLLEIVGAIGVVLPFDLWPPHILLLAAAIGLALLMVIACIYHVRRQERAEPSIVLFLLALFIIIGRWPR